MFRKAKIGFLTVLCIATTVFAGEPLRLVHVPTAGILRHGELSCKTYNFGGDGVRAGAALGLWDRLQVGVSYGAQRIVGRGDINVDPLPAFEIRARILHEEIKRPAVVLGVETFGYGEYIDSLSRYEHKSRGAFVVASKNFRLLWGNFGVHTGMNYSFEEKFNHGYSLFLGFDKDFFDAFGMNIEYDLAPSDWNDPYGEGYGYFSASLFGNITRKAQLSFAFFDIFGNLNGKKHPAREVFIRIDHIVF